MENAGTASGCPLEIRDIIREEVQAYFNGNKDIGRSECSDSKTEYSYI